jgi:hypothetical protein
MKRNAGAGFVLMVMMWICSAYAKAEDKQSSMKANVMELDLSSRTVSSTQVQIQAVFKNVSPQVVLFQWSNHEEPSLVILGTDGSPVQLESVPIPVQLEAPKEWAVSLNVGSHRMMKEWTFTKNGDHKTYSFDSNLKLFSGLPPGKYSIRAEIHLAPLPDTKKYPGIVTDGFFSSKPITVDLQ